MAGSSLERDGRGARRRPPIPTALAEVAARASSDEDREPTEEEMAAARSGWSRPRSSRCRRPRSARRSSLSRRQTEQIIDLATQDRLIRPASSTRRSRDLVETFEQCIKEHHDEYVALKAYYSQPYDAAPDPQGHQGAGRGDRGTAAQPDPERLWKAYEQLDESTRSRGDGGKILADLVSLIRFALGQDDELSRTPRSSGSASTSGSTEQESTGESSARTSVAG